MRQNAFAATAQSALDPTVGAYSTCPKPLAGFGGRQGERRGTEWETKGKEGREGEGKKGNEREGQSPPPRHARAEILATALE